MSLSIKIHGGTPKLGKSLCHTCKQAKIVRGQNCEERIICAAGLFDTGALVGKGSGVVTMKVAECGKYHPMNMPWLWEMEEMAWIVEARRRGQSGFQPSHEGDEMSVRIVPPAPEKENQAPTSASGG